MSMDGVVFQVMRRRRLRSRYEWAWVKMWKLDRPRLRLVARDTAPHGRDSWVLRIKLPGWKRFRVYDLGWPDGLTRSRIVEELIAQLLAAGPQARCVYTGRGGGHECRRFVAGEDSGARARRAQLGGPKATADGA